MSRPFDVFGLPRRGSVSLWAGTAVTAIVVAVAVVSHLWTPFAPEKVDVLVRLKPPGAGHWLGTDHFGRDIASMLMSGAGSSLGVAAAAVAIGVALGVPLGLVAAARRGWCDEIVARLADLLFAFPALLTAILLAALMGPGAPGAILALGLFNVAVLARVTRGAAQGVWRRDFLRAALALGRGRTMATLVHVLPNVGGVVAVQATSLFAVAILNEAALSYLGLGIQPPAPSWGRMLNDAQTFLFTQPLQAVFPGAAIVVTVLGLNLLGDGLRDLLDPRHSGGPPL